MSAELGSVWKICHPDGSSTHFGDRGAAVAYARGQPVEEIKLVATHTPKLSVVKTPESRRRAVYAALKPYLRELESIERMYPPRSIARQEVAQAAAQLSRAMTWAMEGIGAAPAESSEPSTGGRP